MNYILFIFTQNKKNNVKMNKLLNIPKLSHKKILKSEK